MTEEGRKRLSQFRTGKKLSEEVKEKIRKSKIGKKLSKETKEKVSKSLIGNTRAKGTKRSFEDRLKIKERTPRGERHWNWQGGIHEENLKIRKSFEYVIWRERVFSRDKFTCVICGDNKGGNLEADHIKPFAYYPELRFEVSNGRTLCRPCHIKTDTWGKKALKHSGVVGYSILTK